MMGRRSPPTSAWTSGEQRVEPALHPGRCRPRAGYPWPAAGDPERARLACIPRAPGRRRPALVVRPGVAGSPEAAEQVGERVLSGNLAVLTFGAAACCSSPVESREPLLSGEGGSRDSGGIWPGHQHARCPALSSPSACCNARNRRRSSSGRHRVDRTRSSSRRPCRLRAACRPMLVSSRLPPSASLVGMVTVRARRPPRRSRRTPGSAHSSSPRSPFYLRHQLGGPSLHRCSHKEGPQPGHVGPDPSQALLRLGAR